METDEDVTFRPDEAEMRSDEKECSSCHYLHYHKIDCPNCNPRSKNEYERLSGATQNR